MTDKQPEAMATGAAYAAQDSEHQRAIMEGERNASLDAYSRVVSITSAESRLYERAFTSGWDRRDRLASYGQAPATAAEEIDKALNVYAQAFAARVNGWTRQNGDDLPGARSALFAAIHAYAQASTRPTTSPQADNKKKDPL